MATEEKSLSTLPVDAQVSILSFLARGDLARFSVVSRGCRTMATMDQLWTDLLACHFGDVDRATLPSWGPTPAVQFRALAMLGCSDCHEVLLPAKPRVGFTRYPNPHSCDRCGRLCCPTCHCQCRAMAKFCDQPRMGIPSSSAGLVAQER
jgi:hypothetical protein